MRFAQNKKLLIYTLLSTLLVSAPASAKPRHQQHVGFCYFGDKDVQVLGTYYAPRAPRSLPPGLAKKVARTGKLPPGWQKKMQPIPADVQGQLVPLPRDYQRGIVDGFAIVYNSRTGVTIDIVALVDP
ncbi:MAG: hypothetical protein WBD07_13485 [Vicinamibacterales bacterium]